MTRIGVSEYVEATRQRYRRADRGEKGRILDEATAVTGYHRKALIRLLGPIRPVDRGDVVVGPVAMVLGWPRPSRLHGRRQTASARKGFSPSFLS